MYRRAIKGQSVVIFMCSVLFVTVNDPRVGVCVASRGCPSFVRFVQGMKYFKGSCTEARCKKGGVLIAVTYIQYTFVCFFLIEAHENCCEVVPWWYSYPPAVVASGWLFMSEREKSVVYYRSSR